MRRSIIPTQIIPTQRLGSGPLHDQPVEDVCPNVGEGQLRDADAELMAPWDDLVDVRQGGDGAGTDARRDE